MTKALGMAQAVFWPCGRLLPSGGQGWGGVLTPSIAELDTHGLILGFAGVREMYEGHIDLLRYPATPVGRINMVCGLSSYFFKQVRSATNALAS